MALFVDVQVNQTELIPRDVTFWPLMWPTHIEAYVTSNWEQPLAATLLLGDTETEEGHVATVSGLLVIGVISSAPWIWRLITVDVDATCTVSVSQHPG